MEDELKKILDIIIKEKGGSYKDYRLLMDKIGYHESKLDSKSIQKLNNGKDGYGRGKYQYEVGDNRGANTAVNRLYSYYKDNKLPIPKWVKNIPSGKSVDASKLKDYQQDILFLADKMKHPKADFSKVINGEQSTTDFWLKNHWSGKDKDVVKRTESFNRDLESFKTQKQPVNNIPTQEDLYSYIAKPNVGKFPSEDPNEYDRGFNVNQLANGGSLNGDCGGEGQPPCKEIKLDEVTIKGNLSEKMKAYKDSLNLYNKSIRFGKSEANALAKFYAKSDEKFYEGQYNYKTKKWSDFALKNLKEDYNLTDKEIADITPKKITPLNEKIIEKRYYKNLVDPITKGIKPPYGEIYKYKKNENYEDSVLDEKKYLEDVISRNKDGNTVVGGSYSHVDIQKNSLKNIKNILNESKRLGIKPVGELYNAELTSVPIFKKPTAPKRESNNFKAKGLDLSIFKKSNNKLIPSPFGETSWDVTSSSKAFQDRGTNNYSNSTKQKFKNKSELEEYIKREKGLGHKVKVKGNIGRINQLSEGGQLNSNINQGEFNEFNTGGSHQVNPHGGIPMGMGQNGKINTTEQNESSFDFSDGKYIFSARLDLNGKAIKNIIK